MSYYNVISVKASGLAQTKDGPSKEASDMLSYLGFMPDVGYTRESMNEGAVPKDHIIVRYETSRTPYFQLFGIERHGEELRRVELDSAKVNTASHHGDRITIYGNGSKLSRWEITLEDRKISDPTELSS